MHYDQKEKWLFYWKPARYFVFNLLKHNDNF